MSDLPAGYKVFAFYYPSAMRDDDLERALRGLGDLTGRNLFVNIGKLNDPAFDKIVKMFDIRTYPVVVVTATADLAAAPDGMATAFVRLDNDRLLTDPARTIALLQELHGLFLRGEIADAMVKVQRTQQSELVRAVAKRITDGLRHLVGFVADRDIKISLATGSFELIRSSH